MASYLSFPYSNQCINAKKCAKRYGKTNPKHNDCNHAPCTSIATIGKIGSKERIYCTTCLTQLARENVLNKADYQANTKVCMNPSCESALDAKFGFRDEPIIMCKECASNEADPDNLIVNRDNKPCELKDENGKFVCKKQFRSIVNEIRYCGTHSQQIQKEAKAGGKAANVVKRNACSVEGCNLDRVGKDLCSKHGGANVRTDLCRDCHKIRATYSDGELKRAYCSGCYKKRNPSDPKPRAKKGASPKVAKQCKHIMNPDDEEKADADGTTRDNIIYCTNDAVYDTQGADVNPRCEQHKLADQ